MRSLTMSDKPKHFKFPKVQGGRLGPSTVCSSINFGDYGLKASESGRITARQLEAARRVLSRGMGRKGKFWFKAFPFLPETDKPNEARMGKGKGSVSYYYMYVSAGATIVEMSGIPELISMELLSKVSHKFAFRTRCVSRSTPIL